LAISRIDYIKKSLGVRKTRVFWGQIFNLDNGWKQKRRSKRIELWAKELPRLKGSSVRNKDLPPITERLTGATSWKQMGKVTGCDRPGNDLTGNPHHGRTQTHKKRTNNLTGNLKPLYL
jgi:hypothetical protein